MTEPRPSPNTIPLLAVGVILCGAAFYLFYNAGFNQDWSGISYFVFSVILFIGGVYCFRGAYRADQKHAEDMKARAEAHSQRVAFEQNQVSLENVREESQMEAMMRRMKQELEMLRIEVEKRMVPIQEQTGFMRQFVEQREMALRAQYLKPASERGVSVDQYMQLNEHWDRRLIDLEIEKREVENLIKAAWESDDAVTKQQVNKRLLKHAEELITKYGNLKYAALCGDDENADALVDLYGDYIEGMVDEYSAQGIFTRDGAERIAQFARSHIEDRKRIAEGRSDPYHAHYVKNWYRRTHEQNGLVPASIRKEINGHQSQDSDSGEDY